MLVDIKGIQNTAKTVHLYLKDTATGNPMTGVGFGDISPLYAKKPAGSSFAYTLTAATFVEIDSVNLPGLYSLILSASLLDSLGLTTLVIPKHAGALTNEEVILSIEVSPELTEVDLTSVTSELTAIKGAGFDTATDSLRAFRVQYASDISSMTETFARILGLSQENFVLKDHVYDANGNLTESTMVIYPSRDDLILEQNPLASYRMLAAYDGQQRLTDYSVRKNP